MEVHKLIRTTIDRVQMSLSSMVLRAIGFYVAWVFGVLEIAVKKPAAPPKYFYTASLLFDEEPKQALICGIHDDATA